MSERNDRFRRSADSQSSQQVPGRSWHTVAAVVIGVCTVVIGLVVSRFAYQVARYQEIDEAYQQSLNMVRTLSVYVEHAAPTRTEVLPIEHLESLWHTIGMCPVEQSLHVVADDGTILFSNTIRNASNEGSSLPAPDPATDRLLLAHMVDLGRDHVEWCGQLDSSTGESGVAASMRSSQMNATIWLVTPTAEIVALAHARAFPWFITSGIVLVVLVPLGLGLIHRAYTLARRRLITSFRSQQRAEDRYRQVFHQNPAIKLLIEPKTGVIVDANPAACAFYGHDRLELLSKTIDEISEREPNKQGGSALAHTTGIPGTVYGKHRLASGEVRDVELDVSTLEDTNDEDILYAVVRDITERKRLEEEILIISERERRTIGQDLHDGLGQQLTGIAFLAADLEENLAPPTSDAAVEAHRISDLVNDAISHVRKSSKGLHPIEPGPTGLAMALQELATNITSVFEVACRFQGDQEALIDDDDVATHLYRIAQEAVSNAIRHGQANCIALRLEANPDRYLITIQDDGSGLHGRNGKSHGMGWRIMNHRASAIGGTLLIEHAPGGGVVITCHVDRRRSFGTRTADRAEPLPM